MSRRRSARHGRWWKQLVSLAAVAAMIAATILILRGTTRSPGPDAAIASGLAAPVVRRSFIPYDDASRILEAFAGSAPADLRNQAGGAVAWDAWIARHDAAIRARLAGGDEDSAVNFWLYGTSFTARPRATARELARLDTQVAVEALLIARLDDLVSALAAPVLNERVQFVRSVLERRGINPATPDGADRARAFLVEARERTMTERAQQMRAIGDASSGTDAAALAAYATLYRDRGLSSDTSIAAAFAIDRALSEMASGSTRRPGSIARVAIVGPGLDFADKAEGYDFYPVQTIQPFAVVDSLLRNGLARAGDLRVTTFDLSPRVNRHLEAARDRAGRDGRYELQLPLVTDDPAHTWRPDFVEYWHQIGTSIGADVVPLSPPPGAGQVRMRAVRIRPEILSSLSPVDLNIVTERPSLGPGDRFDLVIATNILVYYDPFEQALALANVAAMLRPGGYLLTNSVLSPTAPFGPTAEIVTKVLWDQQNNGDSLFWYRRR